MKQKIILISGKKRSGKDSTADFINCYIQTQKYSFADPLKVFCMRVFGLTYDQCYGTTDEKETPSLIKWTDLPFGSDEREDIINRYYGLKFDYPYTLTARQVLEIFGTDICRKMNYDCWVQATSRTILETHPPTAVIADCRFPNEIDYFVNNPDYETPLIIRLGRDPYQSKAASEVALDKYDWSKFGNNFYYIDNKNCSIEEKNEMIFNQIIKPRYEPSVGVTK